MSGATSEQDAQAAKAGAVNRSGFPSALFASQIGNGSLNFAGRLSRRQPLGGKRRGEETASQSAEECPPMHYWIT